MPDHIASRARAAGIAVLLFLGVLAVYSNHFTNDFHFDDAHTIQSNPYIRDLHNIGRFFTDARTFSTLPDHLHYFTQFFVPLELCADTGGEPLALTLDSSGIFGLCLLGGLVVAAWRTARHAATRPVSFGIAWSLLALAPTSLVPLAEARNDHRMFFPFVGLTFAVAWTVALLIRNLPQAPLRRIAVVACAAALCVYGYGAHRRNEVWRTEESLWRDVVEKNPSNGRGLMNDGLTRMSKGDLAAAYDYFQRARIFVPNYSLLEINLGVACGGLRRDAEAEEHFHRAMALAPNDSQSYSFYARWLQAHGRDLDAMAAYQRAQALNPADPRLASYRPTPASLLDLSVSYYRQRRFQDCIDASQRALRLRPDLPEAYNNIAAAYQAMGQWQPAILAANQALRLRPNFRLARNNLVWSQTQLLRKN